MKTLFNIGNKTEGDVLLCELGQDYACFATAHGKDIHSVQYFNSSIDAAHVNEILKNTSFQKMVISSAYPEALVIPNRLFKEEESRTWLKDMFSLNGEPTFHNTVNEWQVVVAYALPNDINKQVQNVQHWHVYACLLKSPFIAESQINIHFSPKYFRVVVKKGNALQLCQTYPYATPLDVVYYLLNICQKFGLSQEATHLSLSGLIEKDSALYKEIYQYFSDVAFHQTATFNELNTELPSHYFTSIYQLATCAL